MTPLRLALALMVTWGVLARTAGGAVLCRTPKRAVVERAACRARETPVPLVDVGPAGPAGAPGPTGAPGRGAASIADADGTAVGPVIWLRDEASRSLTMGQPIAFALLRHEALGGPAALGILQDGHGTGTVYYTGTGCTGTAYVASVGFLPQVHVIGDDVFVPTTPAPRTDVRAYETTGTQCTSTTPRGGCCIQFIQSISEGFLSAAAQTTLGALGLRAPFRAPGE